MIRFISFIVLNIFFAFNMQAVLFNISPALDKHECFDLSVLVFVPYQGKVCVLAEANEVCHALTVNRHGNSIVLATLRPSDVHAVNLFRFSKKVRERLNDLDNFSFLVTLSNDNETLYQKIYPEPTVDEDTYMVCVLKTEEGNYKIEEGEIIIKAEGS